MTDIYHITHIEHLATILAEGGLWCDRESATKGLIKAGIAHQHIKDRRARRMVPVGAGGTLADYVPFYFGPRSPMLYAIHTNNVEGYSGGQAPVVHLVTDVATVLAAGLPFVYTDGHADIDLSRFETDPAILGNVVDLPLMQARYWFDTDTQPDRKRRRQAEFLVHDFFPWNLFKEVGVIDQAAANQVTAALGGQAHLPPVLVRRAWYY